MRHSAENEDKVFEADYENGKGNVFSPITRTDDQLSIESDFMPSVDGPRPAINAQLYPGELIKHVRITREPGTGLGVSIAGGIGSSPYKDNDQVRHFGQVR